MINTDLINKWRAKQRVAFESDPLPIVQEFKSGRSAGQRISNLVGGTLYFASPIVVFIAVFIPLLTKLNPGLTLKIFLYLILIAMTKFVWKFAFHHLGKALGSSTKEDFLLRAASYLDKKGKIREAARYYLEMLTAPWVKRIDQNGYNYYWFWNRIKDSKDIDDNYRSVFSDLLFVELWLEVELNPEGGMDRSNLKKIASNSERLFEFASIVNEMGKNQNNEDGKPHPVILRLSKDFEDKSPRISAMVVSLEK